MSCLLFHFIPALPPERHHCSVRRSVFFGPAIPMNFTRLVRHGRGPLQSSPPTAIPTSCLMYLASPSSLPYLPSEKPSDPSDPSCCGGSHRSRKNPSPDVFPQWTKAFVNRVFPGLSLSFPGQKYVFYQPSSFPPWRWFF